MAIQKAHEDICRNIAQGCPERYARAHSYGNGGAEVEVAALPVSLSTAACPHPVRPCLRNTTHAAPQSCWGSARCEDGATGADALVRYQPHESHTAGVTRDGITCTGTSPRR
jgi:hypothetical protein